MAENGVWIAFYYDFSEFVLFDKDSESEARSHAAENSMEVDFAPFGKEARDFLLNG